MILAAPLLALVISQGAGNLPTKAVTYHTRAKLLPKVLEEIAEKSGEKLKCGMTLANEVVIMEVKDAPLSDLMPQLAEAVCGKWTKSQDEWILSLDANRARQEERAEIAARKPLFEKALKPYFEGLEKPFGGKDADELIKRIKATQPGDDGGFTRKEFDALLGNGAQSPGGRAIGRALRSIDLSHLAALKEGDRIVFSTHPTLAQIPLGASARNLIPQLVKEQEIWSAARAGFPSQGARVGLLTIGDVYDQNPIVEAIGKAIVVVEQVGDRGSTSVDFQLANQEGRVIYGCRAELNIDSPAGRGAPEIPKSLKWSERTERLFSELRKHTATGMFGMEPRVSESLEREISNCTVNDPDSTFTSDLFFAVGRASATNWIGVPDDEYWYWNLTTGLQSDKGELPKKLYWYDERKNVRNGANWSVLRPSYPAKARHRRIDRKQLVRLLRSVQESRFLSLEALSEYVHSTGRMIRILSGESFLVNLVSREPNFGQRSQLSPATLALYGSLSAPQRQHLFQGGALAIGQLTPSQIERTRRLFFEANPNISMQPLSKLNYQGERGAHFRLGGTLRLEPTEVLNLGILPGTTKLSMTDSSQETLLAEMEGEYKSYKSSTPYFVGNMIGQNTSSKQLRGGIAGFRMGSQRTVKLQVDATDVLQVLVRLSEFQYDYRQPLRQLADLPEGVRADYEKGYAKGLEDGVRYIVPEPRKSPPPP